MLIEPVLPCNYQSYRNKSMALCALHLAQGSTILSSIIKSTTIKYHLKSVSSIPLKFKQIDPLLEKRGLEAQCIKEVLSEVKQWESMPNRKEPVAVKMVLCMYKKCKNKHPYSLDFFLYDWIFLGIFFVFRLYK